MHHYSVDAANLAREVFRMLEERRRKVEHGVRDAESAKRRLQEIERSRTEVLTHAGQEADEILSNARAAGVAKERELLGRGEAMAEMLLREAQLQAQELKARALQESKQEVAKLIVLGIERVLRQNSGQAATK